MTSDTTGQPRLTDTEIDALERNIEPYDQGRSTDNGRTTWTETVHRCLPAPDARRLIADLRATRAELAEMTRDDPTLAQLGAYRRENERLRAELAELRRVVAEAVAAMRQCNWAVSGLPGCITDALDRVPLTYEDERSVGERETYAAIRALAVAASTEQEGT